MIAYLIIKNYSERVPEKNFRELGGKPLFRWILDTLQEVVELERIVINTDARDRLATLGLVESERLVLRDRREDLRENDITANTLIAADLDEIEGEEWLMTHVTNPFLSAETIRSGIARYRERVDDGSADSLFSVNRVSRRLYGADGDAINHDPKKLIPTQDLPPVYEENSCLYIFSKASFRATGARIGLKPLLFEMPRLESLDIDDMEDWRLAEMMTIARKGNNR